MIKTTIQGSVQSLVKKCAKIESYPKCNISKTSASVSSGVPNTETDESRRPQAECFYCLEVFGTPDETRSTSFWYSFLNELPTIIACYFCFFLLIKQ